MDFLQDVVFVFNVSTVNSSSICRIPNRFINIYFFLLVCSVVGTLCSALVIKILHKNSLQNPYEIYLHRMVILDLTICSILIPTSVVFLVPCIPSWIKAIVYTANSFAVGLSLNFLVGVAIQRVLAIKKPFTLGRNPTVGHRGSLICIMVAALKTALDFGRYIPGINMDQFAYANSMFGFAYFMTCFALVIACYVYILVYIIKRLRRKNAVEDGTTEDSKTEQIEIGSALNVSTRGNNIRNPANVAAGQDIKTSPAGGRKSEGVTPGTSVFGGGNPGEVSQGTNPGEVSQGTNPGEVSQENQGTDPAEVTPGRSVVQPENNPNDFTFSKNVMKQNWITAVSHGKIGEVTGDSNLGCQRAGKRYQMMYQPGEGSGSSTSGGGRRADKRYTMVCQSAITFTIVSCVFFFSRCPIFFGDVLNLFNATSLRVFIYLVNVVNPFIYCFTYKKLQLQLKKKICCKRD